MKHFTGSKEEIEKKCKEELTEEIIELIENANKQKYRESLLISVLHKVQGHFRFLSNKRLEAVAYLMNIPSSKVSGVASFYHFFHLKPRGKYVIGICLGTACHVKGADKLVEKLQEELGIKLGETTSDNLFTLEGERCIGTCALAPVVKVDDKIYPQVTPDQIPKLLEEYFNKK